MSDVSPAPTPRTNPGRELLERFAPDDSMPASEKVTTFHDDLRQRIVAIEEAAARITLEELARAEPDPVRAAAAPLEPPRDDADVRYLLWVLHGHDGKYGDDGEMQCAQCGNLDYRRDPLPKIVAALTDLSFTLSPARRAAPLEPQNDDAR